jgi:DME family drug/metabolite transporter
MQASTGRGVLFVSIAATSWGTGGAVAALLYRTSGLGPVAVSFWRFILGVGVLAVVVTIRRRRQGTRRRQPWWLLVLTGIGLAESQTAYFGSVQQAGAAIGTVVTIGTGPILIALGARFLLRERLGWWGTGVIAVALAGLVLLVGDTGRSGPRPAVGVVWALLSAAGYSGVTLLTRAVQRNGDALDNALAGFGIGTLCLLPVALVQGIVPYRAGLAGTAGWLLYLGMVPTALGYGLFFAGLATVPATTASVVVMLEPLTAAAIAVTALGERLTAGAAAGGVLMLGAVAGLAIRRS